MSNNLSRLPMDLADCIPCKAKDRALERAVDLNVLWTRALKYLLWKAGGQVAVGDDNATRIDEMYSLETKPHPDGSGLVFRVVERAVEDEAGDPDSSGAGS